MIGTPESAGPNVHQHIGRLNSYSNQAPGNREHSTFPVIKKAGSSSTLTHSGVDIGHRLIPPPPSPPLPPPLSHPSPPPPTILASAVAAISSSHHPCENFAFPPPPPPNRRRIGPRRKFELLFFFFSSFRFPLFFVISIC